MLEDVLSDSLVADHLAACQDCTTFFASLKDVKPVLDQYRVREPSEELVETVLNRAIRRHAADRFPERARTDAGLFRVLLAGLVSLPLVILINALMGWGLYELATSFLPRTIALYCVGLFVAWASLAMSFGYASLPFLGALVQRPPGRLRPVNP
jgi:hypothetical protein